MSVQHFLSITIMMLFLLFKSQAVHSQQWPTQPGSHTIAFDMPDGGNRYVRVHLPTGFDKVDGISRPLVVALHGGGGNGSKFESVTGYDLKADAENFIVVFPYGTGNPRTWNASEYCCGYAKNQNIDDVLFIREMVKSLMSSYSIDESKIYAAGFSNGGVMAWRLGCDAPDLFDAIGVIAADSTKLHDSDPPCDLGSNTIRIVNLHGDADLNMPYEGGKGKGQIDYVRQPVEKPNPNLYGGQTDIGLWTEMNGCSIIPVAPREKNSAFIKSVYCGFNGLQIVNYRVKKGGHAWYPDESSNISSTDITWNFFKNGADVLLFSDGFESGNFTSGGWLFTGNPIVSSPSVTIKNKSATLRGTSSISRPVSTVGAVGVRVEYNRFTRNLNAGEYLFVEWSIDGKFWNRIETTQSNILRKKSVILPVKAAGKIGFRIRFRTNANLLNEIASVDNIKIIAH